MNWALRNLELDILITGGIAVTMSATKGIIKNPEIGIKDGKILFIRKKNNSSRYIAREYIDTADSLIIPGLVNTHTHLPMICFRGLADDLPLMDWLNSYIFPAEAKYVNSDMVYHGSRLAIAEMILSGTTTFCDGYFYESSIAQAAIDSGVRAVPAQGFVDFPTSDIPDTSKNKEIAEQFIKKWTGISPLITPALFCHAPYTCSPQTLQNIKDISRDSNAPFLIHLSETRAEVKNIKDTFGRTPIHHLHSLNILDERTIAVHCVWPEDEEINILSDYGVKVSHNPESNMKLASGVAPIPKMLDKNITVGLGTDGCASNNDLDMLLEMDTTAKVHKVTMMDPTVMDAKSVLEIATIRGAEVLGLENEIGSLEEGKQADITIIDARKPHLTPLYHCYSHIVYAASGSDVSSVIINGRIVMKDREIFTMDLSKTMGRIRKIADTIRKDLQR